MDLYFLLACAGVIVWGVRQEGRINVAEKATADLDKLISIQLLGIDKRLERIERALNGTLKSVLHD